VWVLWPFYGRGSPLALSGMWKGVETLGMAGEGTCGASSPVSAGVVRPGRRTMPSFKHCRYGETGYEVE